MANKVDQKYPEMDCYLNEELSNVWFVIDGQRLPANKDFLAVKSRVFRAQFSRNFADCDQNEIKISDATVDGFKVMLRFLYTDQLVLINDKSLDLCFDVYNLSHKYQLDRLKDTIESHMKINLISGHNFSDIYVFAFERNFEELMNTVKQYMMENIKVWADQDMNKIIEMNDKTDNSLIEIIVLKYRDIKKLFDQKLSYHSICLVAKDIMDDPDGWGHQEKFGGEAKIKNIIHYNLDKLSI